MTDTNDKPLADDEKKRQRERVERLLLQPAATSTGSVTVGGKALHYSASAGFVPIVANMSDSHKGEPDAALFLTSYTLQHKGQAPKAAERPLLFAFNGGPGSASVWLHLGAFGPKRVLTANGRPMPAAASPMAASSMACPVSRRLC